MIAGFVASALIYLAFLVVLCVCDVDTIMAINDCDRKMGRRREADKHAHVVRGSIVQRRLSLRR